jgi:WD40 repeat protein
LSNGFINGDGKLDFYNSFANWLESWSEISDFCLSKQTSKALITTLRSQSLLIKELLYDGYDFVLGRRLQSDPLEKRFSQYRQMSGGRFLVSLREVITSERILICRSLLKVNVNFWEENLHKENPNVNELINIVSEHETEIFELSLSPESKEVAFTIAGYVAKKLLKRSKCNNCKENMVGDENDDIPEYFQLLSRGGLTVPSVPMAEYVC